MTESTIPAHPDDAGATKTRPEGYGCGEAPKSPQNRDALGFTCGGCDTRWTGFNRCHCSGCHRTFSGLALFDAHRRDIRGVGTCLNPAQITTKTGDPAMRLDGGLWRGPELTAEQKTQLFGRQP